MAPKKEKEPETMDPAEMSSEQLLAREAEIAASMKSKGEEANKHIEAGNLDAADALIAEIETLGQERTTARGEIDARAVKAQEAATKLTGLLSDLEPEAPAEDENKPDEAPKAEEDKPAVAPVVPVANAAPAAPAAAAPVQVAASATPRLRIQVPAAVDLGLPNGADALQPARPQVTILASADNGVQASGAPYTSLGQLGEAFYQKARALKAAGRGSARLAQVRGNWPEDHLLTQDGERNSQIVQRVMEEFMGMDVVTASGCAIAMPYYGVESIGERGTVVIDSLPQFGVSGERGSVQLELPPRISDLIVDGEVEGVGYYTSTEEDDDEFEKTVLEIDCGTPITVDLEATYFITEVKNFVKMANPERFQAIYNLGLSWFDRAREKKALKWIHDGTTVKGVTIPTYLSSFRDTINGLAKEMAHVRSYFRLGRDFRFQWDAPLWLFDALVADVRNQMPGDNTVNRAQEIVREAFAELNLSPVWYWDEPLGTNIPQISLLQDANNPVREYRDVAQTYLYPAGSYSYIGGETLNFGTEIRDFAQNKRNRVGSFYELSEAVLFTGSWAAEIRIDVCTRGAAATLEDVDCVAGS